MRTRWLWFWILLAVSVALTVAGTLLFRNPFLALFLFLPFGPWLFGGRSRDEVPRTVRRCPRCGFETGESWVAFCPRDGSPLQPGGL